MRKFLTSVADVYAYDENEALLFQGKTLLDSSIEVSLGSTPIRGGKGNQLQYVYYHTGEMSFTITEAQWNLAFLAKTVGQTVSTSANIYVEEDVQVTRTINAITGTVSDYTPIASGSGATIYGWYETPYTILQGLDPIRATFTASSFTSTVSENDTIASTDYVCVRYYAVDSDATELVIPANMIPSIVKLVMETQLNSSDVATNQIGTVQVIIPSATLSGAFTISMTADGVSTTPLTGLALASLPDSSATPCSSVPYYARIVENITSANWYDDVIAITAQGGDIALATSGTTTPVIWAVPSSASKGAFVVDPLYLDFAIDSGTSVATVGAHTGLITAHGTTTGTSYISVTIRDKMEIDTTITVVVS